MPLVLLVAERRRPVWELRVDHDHGDRGRNAGRVDHVHAEVEIEVASRTVAKLGNIGDGFQVGIGGNVLVEGLDDVIGQPGWSVLEKVEVGEIFLNAKAFRHEEHAREMGADGEARQDAFAVHDRAIEAVQILFQFGRDGFLVVFVVDRQDHEAAVEECRNRPLVRQNAGDGDALDIDDGLLLARFVRGIERFNPNIPAQQRAGP